MSEVCQFSAIPYQLKRSSRRRTLALQMGPQGLVVQAPLYLEKLAIDQFIAKKADWVRTHQQQQENRPQQGYSVLGDSLALFGRPLKLKVVDDSVSAVTLEGDTLWVQLSRRVKPQNRGRQILQLLESWYSQEAEVWFGSRLQHFGQRMGLSHRSLQIKSWQTRWGSCHSDGLICLNWRLLLAPGWIGDYVVVHELAHLAQMNHSPAFWQLVASHFPNWQQAKAYLKHHQQQLCLTTDPVS